MRLKRAIATLILALAAVLALAIGVASADDTEAGTIVLQPGDNHVGWVGEATSVDDIFAAIPEARLIYAWDADLRVWRHAIRGVGGPLKLLQPGMAVQIRIIGDEPVEWRRPLPVSELNVEPINPILRSGWRTASLEYAADLDQAANLNSILTVHNEQGLQLQVGCFGYVRQVRLVGDSLGAASEPTLLIDGASVAASWIAMPGGGFAVLRPEDTKRMFNILRRAKSLSVRLSAATSTMATFDPSGLFETPIQSNIDHCGDYADPAYQPVTEAQSGTTNSGASYVVNWNNSRRYTHVSVDASRPATDRGGQPVGLRIYCNSGGLGFLLTDLPAADGEYAVRSRVNDDEWSIDTWQMYTTDSGRAYASFEVDYERLRNSATFEVEIPLSPVVRMSFNLSALFDTPAQANIDNCGIDHWPQTPTYVPIGINNGRVSPSISFGSRQEVDGTVYTWVKSTSETPATTDLYVSLRIDCRGEFGLTAALLMLDPLDSDTTDVTVSVDARPPNTSLWAVQRHTRPDGAFAVAWSPEPSKLMAQLRGASVVTVEIPASAHKRLTFDIAGMLDSRVQDNLEECGYYKPDETRSLPPEVVTCTNDDAIKPSGWMAKATTLLADAYRRADGAWPGFDPREHQVVLAHRNPTGKIYELLTIGVAAPELLGDAQPLSTAGTPFCSLARVNRLEEQTLTVLNRISNFQFQVAIGPRISGLYVMIVDLGKDRLNPFRDHVLNWRAFVMHELFHHYQHGSWTSRYGQDFRRYAYDAGNLELAALEDRALRAAATASNTTRRIRAARHFAAIRLLRSALVASVAHDEGQERSEGTALYLEGALLDALGDGARASSALVTDPTALLRGHGHGVREYYSFIRHYQTGLNILLLLDQLGAESVAPRIEAGMSPAEVLIDHLGVTAEDAERLAAEARAAYDPSNELPDLAIRLAAAAAQEDWDGPGG